MGIVTQPVQGSISGHFQLSFG